MGMRLRLEERRFLLVHRLHMYGAGYDAKAVAPGTEGGERESKGGGTSSNATPNSPAVETPAITPTK